MVKFLFVLLFIALIADVLLYLHFYGGGLDETVDAAARSIRSIKGELEYYIANR